MLVRTRPHQGTGFLIAVAATAAALLLRWLAWPILQSEMVFLLFWPVVISSAWVGGVYPGLLGTGLSVGAALILLASAGPEHLSRPAELVGLAVFLLVGGTISLLAERTYRARNQAERRLEWLRVTLGSIGDGVITTDEDGKVTFLNVVAEAMTGWPRDQANGRPLEEVFHIVNEQSRELVEAPVKKVLSTGTIVGLANHTLLISRDGRETSIADSAAPIRDDQSAILGVVLVFRDASKERQAERALAEANQHKDHFLAMLGHELRNCLAPASNALHLIRRPGEQRREVLRDSCDILDRQVQQMGRLVDDLLDLSRIGRGKLQLRSEPVDLVGVVRRAVEMSRPWMQVRRHELQVSEPGGSVWVEGDSARLIQVLTNLLNNAARYTNEGGRISLCLEARDQRAEMRVRDNGIGIPAEVLPRVFHLYEQGDTRTEHTREGLGIGLALVRNLVEMHRGSVEATSAGPGRGSEFVVLLPLTDSRPEAGTAASEPESLPRATRKILVIDDHTDAAESLAMLLRLLGNETTTAGDGPKGLEKARSFHPDVILLDIGLPGMDGYEVARRLRELPTMSKTLLIALTGHGREEDQQRSLASGFDAHLVKPVDLESLQKMLSTQGV